MTLIYQSTRDENNKVTASQAILQGLASDDWFVYPCYHAICQLGF